MCRGWALFRGVEQLRCGGGDLGFGGRVGAAAGQHSAGVVPRLFAERCRIGPQMRPWGLDPAAVTVVADPDTGDVVAAWAKQRVGRATQALPNGYCSFPLAKTFPHANACLTCPMFVTTAEFLPQHRHQQQQVIELISSAEARGQQRLAQMNRQVLGNLTNIITTLENDSDTAAQGTPNAS
ncbi:hypothetical protein ACIHDR_48785 [Nocardia sp. NPDC052278]|uniref:hypothetical protein n=1 Tax=unclassified Nocardia TaxID=2637762 RepID=UPI00367B9D4E